MVGKPVVLKVEKFLDRMCERISAVIFIQKCFRGFKVRKEVSQKKEANKQQELKKKLKQQKAVKIICENIELVLGRLKNVDEREEPFSILVTNMYDSIVQSFSEEQITKVVLIPRAVRSWLHNRLQDGLSEVLDSLGNGQVEQLLS